MKVGMTRENIRRESYSCRRSSNEQEKSSLRGSENGWNSHHPGPHVRHHLCGPPNVLQVGARIKFNIYDIHIIFTTVFIIIMFQSSVY